MNKRTTFRHGHGFTLIELLTVIVIIASLVSIMAPSVSRAIQLGRVTVTKTRVRVLSDACEVFKIDNKYYPGQTTKSGADIVFKNSPQGDYYQNATVFLQYALYSGANWKDTGWANKEKMPPGSQNFPLTTEYAPYSVGTLIPYPNPTDPANPPPPVGISDGFSLAMPILYFVSTPGVDGTAQYDYKQNNAYADFYNGLPGAQGSVPKLSQQSDLDTFINAKAWPGVKDKFLLVAPGAPIAEGTRGYFDKYTTSNITN